MLPTHFLYHAAGEPPVDGLLSADDYAAAKRKAATYPPGGPCYLCGTLLAGAAYPTSKRFNDATWTSHNTAACAASEWLCPACAFSLDERVSVPQWPKPFRMRCQTHYVRGETWTVWGMSDKRAMAQVLMQPPAESWLLSMVDSPLSASHSLYLTPANPPHCREWTVTLGNNRVQGDPETLFHLLAQVELLYNANHTKTAILNGDYNPKWISAQGYEAWARLESSIAPVRETELFELAVFLAQKEDES